MKTAKLLLKEFLDDLCKKELIPIKMLFFLINAAYYSVIPFMIVHIASLGISTSVIGLMYFIQPLVCFPLVSLIGLIVDKIGKIKISLSVFLIASAVITNILPWIPPVIKHSSHNHPITCDPNTGNLLFKDSCSNNKMPSLGGECRAICTDNNSSQINRWICSFQHNKRAKCVEFSKDTMKFNLTRVVSINLPQERNIDFNSTEYRSCNTGSTKIPPKCRLIHCSNHETAVEHSHHCFAGADESESMWDENGTIIIYFIVLIAASFCMAASSLTFDAIVVKMVGEENSSYGLQKAFGIIGGALCSPLSGYLMDWIGVKREDGTNDYRAGFYLYGVIKIFCAIVVLFFPLTATFPSTKVFSKFKKIAHNGEALIFLINMALMGMIWGYIESYLFYFMEELNSPKYVMGLTNTVAGIACLPIVMHSDYIIRVFGHANILISTFFIYAIRLVAYSFVWNPYVCLVIELLEAFTSNLMCVVSVTYASRLAPEDLRASIQGLLTSIHYGIGRGMGQLIGGQLITIWGARNAFRFMAVIATVSGVAYWLEYRCLHLWRKRKSAKEASKQKYDLAVNRIVTDSTDRYAVSSKETYRTTDEI